MILRSSLNPEEQPNLVVEPTRYRKGQNQSALACSICTRTYYVDDATFSLAITAMEQGQDNPFCCDECEAEYEELSH